VCCSSAQLLRFVDDAGGDLVNVHVRDAFRALTRKRIRAGEAGLGQAFPELRRTGTRCVCRRRRSSRLWRRGTADCGEEEAANGLGEEGLRPEGDSGFGVNNVFRVLVMQMPIRLLPNLPLITDKGILQSRSEWIIVDTTNAGRLESSTRTKRAASQPAAQLPVAWAGAAGAGGCRTSWIDSRVNRGGAEERAASK
jgi:hypothetical protein